MTTDHDVTSLVPATAHQSGLTHLLDRSAAAYRRNTATRFGDRSLSYAELAAAVDRTARGLQRLGLKPGDRVGAFSMNSDLYVVLFLAAARAGLIHVPVNSGLKGGELAHILNDSGATVLFVDRALAPLVDEVRASGKAESLAVVVPFQKGEQAEENAAGIASLEELALEETPAGTAEGAEPFPEVRSEDPVQLLYTSGTTSAPKGAVMTHRALVAEYDSTVIALDLTEEDRPLIAMPLYHSAAMHVFAMPYLSLGATLRIIEKPDIERMLQLVQDEHIGSLFLAPTVWVPLANREDLTDFDLSSLTKAQYGASIMPVTVLQRLREAFPKLGFYNCFGQSEMSPLCTVLRPEEHHARPASCGRPVQHVQVRVVDPTGEPVAAGEPGEIQYRSPQLFSGYWNNPEATEAAFMDGWFRSGDQVTQDEGGYIQVVDRIKDVINTGGVLVAPREVEDCVYEVDGVAEVAVIGVPDERWIEAITAVVVLKDGAQVTEEQVIAHVKDSLAGFKVPKAVEFVDELPRNQSGKLLKRVLRKERSEA